MNNHKQRLRLFYFFGVFLALLIYYPVYQIWSGRINMFLKEFPHPIFELKHVIDSGADQARLLYETGSLVGLIGGVLIAIITLFIPIIIGMWSQLTDSIFNLAQYAIDKKLYFEEKDNHSKAGAIKSLICEIKGLIREMQDVNKNLKVPFVVCSIIVMLQLLFSIRLNLLPARNIDVYFHLIFLITSVFILVLIILAVLLYLSSRNILHKKFTFYNKLINLLVDNDMQDCKKKEKVLH